MTEEDRPIPPEQRTESGIEGALDAVDAQLDGLKDQLRGFMESEEARISPAFYDGMNAMARSLGMLKALVTAEEEARKCGRGAGSPVRHGAHETARAADRIITPDTGSD